MVDREQIAEEACKLCEANNGSGCTQMYSPDPEHWICKAWLKKAFLGYTRPAEPAEERVLVVAKIINDWWDHPQTPVQDIAREILNLQPELTRIPQEMIDGFVNENATTTESIIHAVEAQLAHDQQTFKEG